MKKGIIGKKLGMTQIFDENGNVIPVTVIEAGPCTVVQKKTVETDGYAAVQLGFEDVSEKHVTKPEAGHFKKNGVSAKRHLKEFRLENAADMNPGDVVAADTFAAGDKVDITGITKGRGYTGTVKRWGNHILRMTHGTGPVHRERGSTGANSTPSKVIKGLHMAGHYGHERVTIKNLKVVRVDAERNVLLIKGAIPGPKGGLVTVTPLSVAILKSFTSATEAVTHPSTPAFFAFARVSATISASLSKPTALNGTLLSIMSLAAALSRCQTEAGIKSNLSAAKERKSPGAMFRAMSAASQMQIVLRCRNTHLPKENLRHIHIIMLPCMNENFLMLFSNYG